MNLNRRLFLDPGNIKKNIHLFYDLWYKLDKSKADKVTVSIPHKINSHNFYFGDDCGVTKDAFYVKTVVSFYHELIYGKEKYEINLSGKEGTFKNCYTFYIGSHIKKSDYLKSCGFIYGAPNMIRFYYLPHMAKFTLNGQDIEPKLFFMLIHHSFFTNELCPFYFDDMAIVRGNKKNGFPKKDFQEAMLSVRNKWETGFAQLENK